jgi:copper(I)-binding protein
MKLKTLSAILALSSGALFAQTVEVQGAWARATVPGQKATGAFMKITAKDGYQAGERVQPGGRCGQRSARDEDGR